MKNYMIIRKITSNMIMYAVIATDSVAARGLVNGRCLPRSGRRDILSVVITAFIFIGVIFADNHNSCSSGCPGRFA